MRSRNTFAYISFVGVWLVALAAFNPPLQAAEYALTLETSLSGKGAGYRDGAIEQALFRRPQGLRMVGAYLYIVDTGNHCVRRYDPQARIVSSWLGRCETAGRTETKTARGDFLLDHPTDVVGEAQALYVLDSGNNRVVRVTGDEADPLRLIEQPTPLRSPSAMAWEKAGTLYVSDAGAHAVFRIRTDESTTLRIAGTGVAGYDPIERDAGRARLDRPAGLLAYQAGSQLSVFVADSGNHFVRLLIAGENDHFTIKPYAGAEETANAQTRYGAAARLLLGRPYRLADCVSSAGEWVLTVTLPVSNQVATLTLDHAGTLDASPFSKEEPAPDVLVCENAGRLYGMRPDGVLGVYVLGVRR